MTGLEPNDSELLRRYAKAGSEKAFAAIVELHLPLVYSAALRLTGGNAHQAQDVAQSVFTKVELDRLRGLASGLDAARADSDRRQKQRDLEGQIRDLRRDTADLAQLRDEMARLRGSPTLPLQAELTEAETDFGGIAQPSPEPKP